MFLLESKRPLIIAGPCSAESREQLLRTADELARLGKVDVLRAGLWKPRTRPDSFEGVGEEGLAWLAEARERTGLPAAVEVASARHVEAALKAGIELLWIGARTTVNPFLVQEIAEAVGSSEVSVLIKNPMHPDVELWSGAVARFERAGVSRNRLALVHRGFSISGHWRYRNDPMWHLALDMQRRHPDLKMIGDPSHISGCRDYLHEVAQMAADLNYDGLIIESHCDPSKALSDAAQQLTPEALGELLKGLNWRAERSSDEAYMEELARCRSEIDQLDHDLFELLSRRMQVSDRIGRIKRENDVVILQRERWEAIVERVLARAEEWRLSPEFLRTVLEAVHVESIRHQQ